MCDQTEVAYLPNDIVWVKLSNVWWPAEVQDEALLDEDVTAGLKKKPLAIVKFFEEDLYEFPKNLNQIYHYNCLRKDEFIKKGLDLWRAELSRDTPYSMKKFPQDVQTAEGKTGGDPDYIEDPKFLPEEKFDYREKFGLKPLKKIKERRGSITPVPKTPRLSKSPSPKVTFSTPLSIPSTSRALGSDKQTPSSLKKSRCLSTPPSILKDPLKIKKKEEKICSYFPCVFCNYSCKRINNAVSHIKAHLRGLILPHPDVIPTKYESVFEENQKKKTKKILSSEPATPVSTDKSPLKRKSSPESSTSSKKKKNDTPSKKDKSTASPSVSAVLKDAIVSTSSTNVNTPKKRIKKQKITKEKKIESAALEILKDWDDESNGEDHDMDVIPPATEESSITEKSNDSSAESVQLGSDGSESMNKSSESPQTTSEVNKTPEKSCFDFEDTDDSLNLDQSLKFGQKLPRVISEKQSTCGRFKHDLKAETVDDALTKDVERFLETASVPDLPDVPTCTAATSEVEVEMDGMGTSTSLENEKLLQANEISDSQRDVNLVDNSSSVEGIPSNTVVPSLDIHKNGNAFDKVECKNQDERVLVDETEGSLEIKKYEKLVMDSLVSDHPVDSSSVVISSECVSLDNTTKTSMESITSTSEEISPIKGKSEEKTLNLDLSEDYIKSKKKCEVSETDSSEVPMPKVDNKFKTIKVDLPPLTCANAIQGDKVFFPDKHSTKKSLELAQKTVSELKSVTKDDNVSSDNSTDIKYVKNKKDTPRKTSEEISTKNELEKGEDSSVDLKLVTDLEVENGNITQKDNISRSSKKKYAPSALAEIYNETDTVKDESKICDVPCASVEISNDTIALKAESSESSDKNDASSVSVEISNDTIALKAESSESSEKNYDSSVSVETSTDKIVLKDESSKPSEINDVHISVAMSNDSVALKEENSECSETNYTSSVSIKITDSGGKLLESAKKSCASSVSMEISNDSVALKDENLESSKKNDAHRVSVKMFNDTVTLVDKSSESPEKHVPTAFIETSNDSITLKDESLRSSKKFCARSTSNDATGLTDEISKSAKKSSAPSDHVETSTDTTTLKDERSQGSKKSHTSSVSRGQSLDTPPLGTSLRDAITLKDKSSESSRKRHAPSDSVDVSKHHIALKDERSSSKKSRGSSAPDTITSKDERTSPKKIGSSISDPITLKDDRSASKKSGTNASDSISLKNERSSSKKSGSRAFDAITLKDERSSSKKSGSGASDTITLKDERSSSKKSGSGASDTITLKDERSSSKKSGSSASDTITLKDERSSSKKSGSGASDTITLKDERSSSKKSGSSASDTITLKDERSSSKKSGSGASDTINLKDERSNSKKSGSSASGIVTLKDGRLSSKKSGSSTSDSITLKDERSSAKKSDSSVSATVTLKDERPSSKKSSCSPSDSITLKDERSSSKKSGSIASDTVTLKDESSSFKKGGCSSSDTITLKDERSQHSKKRYASSASNDISNDVTTLKDESSKLSKKSFVPSDSKETSLDSLALKNESSDRSKKSHAPSDSKETSNDTIKLKHEKTDSPKKSHAPSVSKEASNYSVALKNESPDRSKKSQGPSDSKKTSNDTITLKHERSDSPKKGYGPSVSKESSNYSVTLKNESSESSKNCNAPPDSKKISNETVCLKDEKSPRSKKRHTSNSPLEGTNETSILKDEKSKCFKKSYTSSASAEIAKDPAPLKEESSESAKKIIPSSGSTKISKATVKDKSSESSNKIDSMEISSDTVTLKDVSSDSSVTSNVPTASMYMSSDTITLKDENSKSKKESSNDVLKCSEVKSDSKFLCINVPQTSMKIDNKISRADKSPDKSSTHDKKDEVLKKELSSDIVAPKKPVNLVSESPSLKAKFDEPGNQMESKLIPNSTKESCGLVRKNSGNDNRHTKKRKIENDTIICKEANEKDVEAITSNIQIESDKSNVFMPEEINVADIPLPADDYPKKTESFSENKKCNQISVLAIRESSDSKEELQTISSCVKEDKEPKNQTISNTQMDFDINSMPVVFANDEPKPVVEYCYGKNIPLHPNADIIWFKIVAKGQEHLVKLKPNQRIIKTIEIKIDPNYKPFHNLLRIPFPLAEDKTALVNSQSNSVSVPSGSQSSSASNKSQSCSTSAENVQGPSTSFAIPEKPVAKNITIKQGVSFSGKASGKSNVRLLQSASCKKVFLVPSTTMGGTKAIAAAQGTVSSGGFRLLKPHIAEKLPKKSQIIINKSNLAAVSKHIPINKNIYGHIKAVPQSLLPGKNQTSRVVTASKVPKTVQRSGSLMKPPNAPAPKILKPPSSAMKGSTLFTQSSSSADQRIITTSASGHVERKISATKLKQSPIILQKNIKRTKQIPVSSAPMSSKPPQSQAPEIVPVPSLSTIVQGESSRTTGEQVVLLTLDGHGNCVPANQILPIVSNESQGGFVNSGSLININTPSGSENIDNFLLTNYIKIGSTSDSSSSKKSGPQDILAEALANTQVLQTDTPELSDATVFQQFPTTSLASSVLETSLTLNQPPIMSPLEVPSSITTRALHIKGKSSEINPSMPLLTDDILSDSSSHVTFQIVNDSQIVVASSRNVLTDASNQIVFASEVLPGQVESGSAEVPSHSGVRETTEDNVLPEFLKGDFNKKSQSQKKLD